MDCTLFWLDIEHLNRAVDWIAHCNNPETAEYSIYVRMYIRKHQNMYSYMQLTCSPITLTRTDFLISPLLSYILLFIFL
jgi:hypothetical protein